VPSAPASFGASLPVAHSIIKRTDSLNLACLPLLGACVSANQFLGETKDALRLNDIWVEYQELANVT
jgi:hypothetical protein